MNETRATGLRTLWASGREVRCPRTRSVADDDECPDLISSSSESGEDEDKYNDIDTDETDEQESNIGDEDFLCLPCG
eukprot:4753073-Karenia_brevis.AAC.1